MAEEKNARREAAGNTGRGGQTQVAVGVEIARRREASTGRVTTEEEDEDLRMEDAEAIRETAGIEASKLTTTEG